MSKNTVQENINRAIQIHVENAVRGLQFNKTELVEIADITNRDKGEYIVFNGSIKYYAYSENTKYALKDKVYVNIPNNDYSQQKIIIGKYKVGGDKVSYISPWDNFSPMTKNVNNDKNIHKISNAQNGSIEILNISSNDLSKCNGYEYMGVKAYFNARFPGANSGNYGIEIALTYNDPQVPGKKVKTKTNYYILDTNSMIGNIYNFPSFYNQEAVFKIPKDIKITKIVATFFCDESLLEYGTISMRNLDLRFGNEKTTEMDSLELYCEQGAEYNSSLGDQNSKNEKILKIKWCHYDKDEEQLKEIDKKTTFLNSGEAVDLYYNIKWYRKIIKKVDGSDVNDIDTNDKNFEKDWEDITSNSNFFASFSASNPPKDLDLFSRKIYPTVLQKEDSFKVIIEYGPKDNNNINTQSYFYKKLESKVYTFKNTVEIPDYTSLDFANTKIIATDDYEGNYHIYDSKNGKILKRADVSKKRELKLEMISSYTNETYLNGKGGETLFWVVPKEGTMINFEPYKKEAGIEIPNDTTMNIKRLDRQLQKYIKSNSYYVIEQTNKTYSINYQIKEYYTKQAVKNTVFCFIYKGNQIAKASLTLTFGQHGTAGTNYTLTFGLGNLYNKNTEGKWVVVGDVDPVLTYGQDGYREILFELYDQDNKKINLSNNTKNTIINNWLEGLSSGYLFNAAKAHKNLDFAILEKVETTNKKNEKIIYNTKVGIKTKKNGYSRKNFSGIVFKISLTSTYVFTQYLPLHVRGNNPHVGKCNLEGSDTIIYSDNGTNPVYYTDPFKIVGYNTALNKLDIGTEEGKPWHDNKTKPGWKWEIDTSEENKDMNFTPSFDNKNELKPPALYIERNQDLFVTVSYVYRDGDGTTKNPYKIHTISFYTFPLIMMQNRYGVPAVNKWDGSLTVDKENNQIFSAMIGAGKKDSENTFSGVLMGEIGTDNNSKLYGLYGYKQGEQTYGFKIDGTAFIGKSGTGRILFDGTNGLISSSVYLKNTSSTKKGACFDVKNGILNMYSQGVSNDGINFGYIQLKTTDPYFTIKSHGKELIKIGKDNYYLQTANYEKDKAGTKLNLKNGSLISHGALTLKGATGSILEFRGNHIDPQDSEGKKTVEGLVQMGLDSSDRPYLYLKENNNFLIRFGALNAYFQSYDYKWTKGHYSDSGMKINLRTGNITAQNFSIDKGNAYFKGSGEFEGMITATSGKIGGWKIDENSLKAGNITINPKGSITSSGGKNSWSINDDGSATFSKVTITGGTLSLNGIKYDPKSLKNNGGWSSVKDWDNNTLGRYIDQRIADFDDVNIWGKLTAHGEVFLNDSNSDNFNGLTIKNTDQLIPNTKEYYKKLIIKSSSSENLLWGVYIRELGLHKLTFERKYGAGDDINFKNKDTFYPYWLKRISFKGTLDDGTKMNITLEDLLKWYLSKYGGGIGYGGSSRGYNVIKQQIVSFDQELRAWEQSGYWDGDMTGRELCPPGYWASYNRGVWGNCTAAAWMMIYHWYGIRAAGDLGNGGFWVDNLVNRWGWKLVDGPVPGAVVSVNPTEYPNVNYTGHVAFFVSVNSDGTYNVFQGNTHVNLNGANVSGGTGGRAYYRRNIHVSDWNIGWDGNLHYARFAVPSNYDDFKNNSSETGGSGNITP